jgi:hypothetical protein
MIKIERPRGRVTRRGNEKLKTLSASNPSMHQCANVEFGWCTISTLLTLLD